MSEHRDICDIVRDIYELRWARLLPTKRTVKRLPLGSSPHATASWCLQRLATLRGLTEMVGLDSGEELVAMFLRNAGTFTSKAADHDVRSREKAKIRALKQELFDMLSKRVKKKHGVTEAHV